MSNCKLFNLENLKQSNSMTRKLITQNPQLVMKLFTNISNKVSQNRNQNNREIMKQLHITEYFENIAREISRKNTRFPT